VVHAGTERCDKVGVGSVEGLAAGDVGKEVLPYELVLGAPNFPSVVVEDGVEVRVSRQWVSARRRSEKVRKEVEVVGDFVEGGRRLYGGSGDWGWVAKRWGWAPNDVFGRWGVSGEDGGDGGRDVLDFFAERDVGDEHIEIGSVGGDVEKEVQ